MTRLTLDSTAAGKVRWPQPARLKALTRKKSLIFPQRHLPRHQVCPSFGARASGPI